MSNRLPQETINKLFENFENQNTEDEMNSFIKNEIQNKDNKINNFDDVEMNEILNWVKKK